MREYSQFAISDTHARGLRRESDRRVASRLATYRLSRKPDRFGPRVRSTHEALFSTLGPERVVLIERTKKLAMWAYCELNATGLYQLRGESVQRRDGGLATDVQNYPLLATPHFYERVIQGFKFEGHTLITTLIDVVRLLIAQVGWADGAPSDQWPTWDRHGNAWFALEYGLAAGDIPAYGEVVLRTIMPTASLHSARRADWESMRESGNLVSVLEPLPTNGYNPAVFNTRRTHT